MSKIVFTYPDFENLGVEYLMAACLEAGHQVDYVSYQAGNPFFGKKSKGLHVGRVAESIVSGG